MNLALRGIETDLGPEQADTFRRDLHPDVRGDYILANPPFNDSDWFRKDGDVRWQFGVPPMGEGSGNLACLPVTMKGRFRSEMVQRWNNP